MPTARGNSRTSNTILPCASRRQTNTTQQSGREEHHYHETTNNAENAMAAIPVHRSDRTLPQHLQRDTNLTGGKEERLEKEADKRPIQHTQPQSHVTQHPECFEIHQNGPTKLMTKNKKQGGEKMEFTSIHIYSPTYGSPQKRINGKQKKKKKNGQPSLCTVVILLKHVNVLMCTDELAWL
jgi:hypothetical protein